jgi:hypothetical protein
VRVCGTAGIGFVILLTVAACHPPVVGDLAPNSSPSPASITISGHSDQVTSQSTLHLEARDYRVSWSAKGNDVLVVTIVSKTQFEAIITEAQPQPASGEVTFHADGGDYHLVIAASTLTWKITFTPM